MNIKPGTYKVEIKNNNEYWYNANGNLIHYKDSTGYETWYEYDANGNIIHYKTSNGLEAWYEYDANGNMIHFKNSKGLEEWYEYDSNGNQITKKQFDAIHNPAPCNGKIVEIEGKKYKLTAI